MSRVLIVDDNSELLRLMGRLVVSLGAEVVCAGTAEEARALANEEFALVFVDRVLGEEDGYGLAATFLREGQSAPRLVLLSGGLTEEVRREALELGFAEALLKPINRAKIAEQLALATGAVDA